MNFIVAVPYVWGLGVCLLTGWMGPGAVAAVIYYCNCVVTVLY
jgi:hypothetical protein